MLARHLRYAGADVATASSVLHARRMLEQEPAHVVVADYAFPRGGNGLSLIREVAERWPNTWRAVLTGALDAEVVSEPLVDALLLKSQTAEGIIQAILDLARRPPRGPA